MDSINPTLPVLAHLFVNETIQYYIYLKKKNCNVPYWSLLDAICSRAFDRVGYVQLCMPLMSKGTLM